MIAGPTGITIVDADLKISRYATGRGATNAFASAKVAFDEYRGDDGFQMIWPGSRPVPG